LFVVLGALGQSLLPQQLALLLLILAVFHLGIYFAALGIHKIRGTPHEPRLFGKKEFTISFASSLSLFAMVQTGGFLLSMACFAAAILLSFQRRPICIRRSVRHKQKVHGFLLEILVEKALTRLQGLRMVPISQRNGVPCDGTSPPLKNIHQNKRRKNRHGGSARHIDSRGL
jgi:hypothetical protein